MVSTLDKAFLLMTLDEEVAPKQQKAVIINNEEDEQPKKDVKIETPTTQWITVLTERSPMKQRYHYNVVDINMHKHVEKGRKDGLFISSVTSSANLWAFIMDARTGFSSQVYEVSPLFMNKKWIMEQWENRYYITSIAGANNGSSLVVMSKGSPYTQQSYKTSHSFPSRWMNKKWAEGYHVTSMTTSKRQWCVVMSRNSGYSKQVVEHDFLYTSEKVHPKCESGYRITSVAATEHQAALILSLPKGKRSNRRQETLRTSTFPTEHIKDLWKKNMFVTSICYGRTSLEKPVNCDEKIERKRKQSVDGKNGGNVCIHDQLQHSLEQCIQKLKISDHSL